MNFNVSSGIWGTMFGVPGIVADNFLKIASGDQIKVLLYLLRNSGRSCTDGEISENTGVPIEQVSESLAFWQQVNVLSVEKSSHIRPVNMGIMTPPSEPEPKKPVEIASPAVPQVQKPKPQNYSAGEIAKMMQDSSEISELLKMAESILGQLNPNQMNSLIWMNTYLGLKTEVIITLLSYCNSIEKTNSAYVEKIACAWSEQDINTLTLATEEVTRMRQSRDYIGKLMSTFEMNRRPTQKQLEFADSWRKIGFRMELLRYAYEKTIEQIDKLSFDYINKILLSWRDSGFATVSDVKKAEAEFKNSRKDKPYKPGEDDFDVDKYKIFINNF